jgi:hypothetical protein
MTPQVCSVVVGHPLLQKTPLAATNKRIDFFIAILLYEKFVLDM